jgi:hypothetical protein
MSGAESIAAAATFLWLGMVLAISFLETPLKFRAPGVTVRIGLGIGRLVFKALNAIEVGLAALVLVALVAGSPPPGAVVPLAMTLTVLTGQLLLVRPRLTRRSDAVLAGEDAPRSHAHFAYAGLEIVKVSALLIGGIVLFASS